MKKILILGGSSDIGRELIRNLNNDKYIFHIHFYQTKEKINKSKNLKFIKYNLKNLDNLESKFDNDYDIIVNLVGKISSNSLNKLNVNDLIEIVKTNSLAMFIISKNCIKNMKKKNYGRIINTSSIGVKFGGSEKTFSYSLSKHINEFIPSLFRNLVKNNILYNVVRIGVTNTKIHNKISNKLLSKRIDMIPMKKIAETSDIANLIKFLIEKNNYITNQILDISGGE